MHIPDIPDYANLLCSGCTLDLVNEYEDGRIYGPVLEYGREGIKIMSVFDWRVKKEWGVMFNYPIVHHFNHLTIDDAIDYFSFTSLN